MKFFGLKLVVSSGRSLISVFDIEQSRDGARSLCRKRVGSNFQYEITGTIEADNYLAALELVETDKWCDKNVSVYKIDNMNLYSKETPTVNEHIQDHVESCSDETESVYLQIVHCRSWQNRGQSHGFFGDVRYKHTNRRVASTPYFLGVDPHSHALAYLAGQKLLQEKSIELEKEYKERISLREEGN